VCKENKTGSYTLYAGFFHCYGMNPVERIRKIGRFAQLSKNNIVFLIYFDEEKKF
jgi:hypothetical protein